MEFKEAVATCLKKKYATFSGRASRSEYWWFYLFCNLVVMGSYLLFAIVGGILFAITTNMNSGEPPVLAAIIGVTLSIVFLVIIIGLMIPSIAVTVRRLHDKNKSGWWFLGFAVIIPVICFSIIFAVLGIVTASADGAPTQEGMAVVAVVMAISYIVMIGTSIWFFILMVTRGTKGPNRFGEDPLGNVAKGVFS